MILVILIHIIAVAAISLAIAFGEFPERVGAAIIIAMIIVSDLSMLFVLRHYNVVDLVSLVDDIIGFLGFSLLAIFTTRIWPLFSASLQLLSVGAHFVRALDIPVRPIVYAWMKTGPTWAVLMILIIGVLASARRRALPDSDA